MIFSTQDIADLCSNAMNVAKVTMQLSLTLLNVASLRSLVDAELGARKRTPTRATGRTPTSDTGRTPTSATRRTPTSATGRTPTSASACAADHRYEADAREVLEMAANVARMDVDDEL